MSGLEVVALVAAIVSAFTGTVGLLKEREQKKAEKRRAKREELKRLQVALTKAHPEVQNRYDVGFANFGSHFRSGDCKLHFLSSVFRHRC